MIPGSGPQLYDLRDDPEESRDLAAENPRRIEAMIDRYRDFMAALPEATAAEEVVAPLDDESRRALEALGYLQPRPEESEPVTKEGP